MKCKFCSGKCDNTHANAWECSPCRATYYEGLGPDDIYSYYLDTTFNRFRYAVRFYYAGARGRTTEIYCCPNNNECPVFLIKEFPFIIESITPQNVNEKLKTILVFL